MITIDAGVFDSIVEHGKPPATDLVAEFRGERAGGATFRQIGDKYGVSHERVRQVLGAAGITYDRNHTATIRKDRTAAGITEWLAGNGPVPAGVLCEEFGITSQRLSELVAHHGVPRNLIMSGAGRTGSTFTAAGFAAAVGGAWARLKEEVPSATGLSVGSYDRVRLPGDPSPALITARMPWRDVCAAAGVPCGAGRGNYTVKWTDEELLGWIGRYAGSTPGRVTFDGYDKWRRAQDGAPSGALVRTRLRRNGYPTWASMVAAGARGDTV